MCRASAVLSSAINLPADFFTIAAACLPRTRNRNHFASKAVMSLDEPQ